MDNEHNEMHDKFTKMLFNTWYIQTRLYILMKSILVSYRLKFIYVVVREFMIDFIVIKLF